MLDAIKQGFVSGKGTITKAFDNIMNFTSAMNDASKEDHADVVHTEVHHPEITPHKPLSPEVLQAAQNEMSKHDLSLKDTKYVAVAPDRLDDVLMKLQQHAAKSYSEVQSSSAVKPTDIAMLSDTGTGRMV